MSGFVCVLLRLLSSVVVAGLLGTGCDSDSRRAVPLEEQETPPSTRYNAPEGNEDDLRRTIRRFMDARVRGQGAERFIQGVARDEFVPDGGLAPLYPKRLTDFAIVFVDGPSGVSKHRTTVWSHYEVGVELVFARGSYGDTLFVSFDGVRYEVTGGRPGLEGP